MRRHIVFIISVIFGLSCANAAAIQGGACTTGEVAVAISNVNGQPYRGVAAEDVIAHGTKGKVTVKALAFDDGPRRVVLVLDANKKLTADSRKAEHELVSTIVAASRPEDSLALIIARGPQHVVKFGEERSTLEAAVPREFDPRSGPELGVLDAVMEAAKMFDGHKLGDSIVVIASDLEGNHSTNPKNVARSLQEHQVRMFGLALGPVSRGSIVAGGQSTTAWGLATVTPGIGGIHYQDGDENFLPLSENSGGAVLGAINGDAHHSYSMNEPRVQQQVKQSASVVWNMIVGLYRMEIQRPQGTRSEDWTLEESDSLRKTIPRMLLLYPHELGPC